MIFPEPFRAFDGINIFCETDVKPLLMAQERRRAGVARRVKIIVGTIISIAVFLIITCLALIPDPEFAHGGAFVVGFMGVFISAIAYTGLTKNLESDVKEILVGKLTEFLGWRFKANNFTPLSVAEFRRLKLLPSLGGTEQVEDHISGVVGETRFFMHELHLITKGDRQTTTFQGQVFEITPQLSFLGETLVLRDRNVMNRGEIAGMKKAGLADPHFEKTFEVYSTDQVEARYLLPPDFMQRILELEEAVDGKNIRLAFSKSKLLITLETPNRLQPGGPFQSYDKNEAAQKIVKELVAIYALIEKLGL